jgi:altronate dehydratase small subunit
MGTHRVVFPCMGGEHSQTDAAGAVLLHPEDTVATALGELQAGQSVLLRDRSGASGATLEARGHVPAYHKIAVRDHTAGERVLKYGEPIGLATRPIRAGEHVHTHNLESPRGGTGGPAGV